MGFIFVGSGKSLHLLLTSLHISVFYFFFFTSKIKDFSGVFVILSGKVSKKGNSLKSRRV
jgi:hypothetical protein